MVSKTPPLLDSWDVPGNREKDHSALRRLKLGLGFGLFVTLAAAGSVFFMLAADVTNRRDQMSNVAVGVGSMHRVSFNLKSDKRFEYGKAVAVRFPSAFTLSGTWANADFSLTDGTSRPVVNVQQGPGVNTVSCSTGNADDVGVAVDTTAREFRVSPCNASFSASALGAMITFTIDGETIGGVMTNPATAGSYLVEVRDAAGDCTLGGADCQMAVAILDVASVTVTAEVVGTTPPGYCGDGTVDAGEECDDGNTSSGDGCSSTCTTEGGGGGETCTVVIEGVGVSDLGTTSATVNWTTNVAVDSLVRYGLTSSYGQSASNSALTGTHAVPLIGLTEGATYHYQVCSQSSTCAQACSGDNTFSTPDETLPVITNVVATPSNITAVITWTTNEPTTSFVDWGAVAGPPYANSSGAATPLATGHSVTLTGLTPGTTYHFRVRSADASVNEAITSDATFTTTTGAPPVISNVQITGISGTGATVTWTTDVGSTTFVDYGTSSGTYTQTAGAATPLATGHSVTLTGLTPGTTYYLRVRSASSEGLEATGSERTLETPETVPPVISNVQVTNVTSSSASVTWTTNEPADSTVNYGLTAGYGSNVTSATLVVSHAATLSGLTPNTTYNFRVRSKDKWGNEAVSGNATFKTSLPPAPVISAVSVTNITQVGARVNWTTSTPTDSRVIFGTSPTSLTRTATVAGTGTAHIVPLSGLVQGTTYYYRIVSTDAYGQVTNSATLNFNTLADTAAPGNVTNFTATPDDAQVALAWTKPSDADLVGVRIVRKTSGFPTGPSDGTVVYSGVASSYLDTGVSNGVQYYYAAYAYDSVPNYSSGAVASATPVGVDLTPPQNVSPFTATPGNGQVSLAWGNPADADFQGTLIVRKELSCPASRTDGTVVYDGPATTRLDTGLSNGTFYCYRAYAHDGVPNYASGVEASATPVAPLDVTPPPPVTGLVAAPGDSAVQLSWINPGDPDYAGTRIVRKAGSYPTGPTDGAVVFEGIGDSRLDLGLTNGTTYYYAAYAYDGSGNFAAPAQAQATPVEGSAPPPPACVDSDGGANYLIKGTVTTSGGEQGVDVCSGGMVQEFYCSAGAMSHEMHDCGEGFRCSDGRCVPDTYVPVPAQCGNGLCEGSENTLNCPADCPLTPAAPPVIVPEQNVTQEERLSASDLLFFATTARLRLRTSLQTPDRVLRLSLFPIATAADPTETVLQAYANMTFTVLVPKQSVPKEVATAFVNFGGSAYAMQTTASGLEANVTSPSAPGVNRLVAAVNYVDGTSDSVSIHVYGVRRPTVTVSVTGTDGEPVSGARVSLYAETGGSYGLFDGTASNQPNPATADQNGRFAFIVPQGRFYLRAEAPEYADRQTLPFDISSDNVVTTSLRLIKLPPSILEALQTEGDAAQKAAAVASAVAEQAGFAANVIAQQAADIAASPIVQEQARTVVAPTVTAVAVVNVVTAASALPYLNYVLSLMAHPILLIARRKRRKWGVVYDSLNKLPVDLAIVRLTDANTGRILRSAVTDKDGRYFFIVGEGKYRLAVVKADYIFPTQYLHAAREDADYIDLYHGEVIEVKKETSLTANIPLDPVKEGKRPWRVTFEGAGRRLQRMFGVATLVVMIVVFALNPTVVMGALLAANLLFFWLFNRLAMPRKPKNWGVVRDDRSNRPLSNVVVRIFETKFNKLLETQVTDLRGRYAFLVGSNVYYVTYEKPGYQKQQKGPVDFVTERVGKKGEPKVVAVDIKLRTDQNAPSSGAKPEDGKAPPVPAATQPPSPPPPVNDQPAASAEAVVVVDKPVSKTPDEGTKEPKAEDMVSPPPASLKNPSEADLEDKLAKEESDKTPEEAGVLEGSSVPAAPLLSGKTMTDLDDPEGTLISPSTPPMTGQNNNSTSVGQEDRPK